MDDALNPSRWRAWLMLPACIALFLLISSIFWWPGSDNSRLAFIRIFVFLGAVYALFSKRRPSFDTSHVLFAVFWGYLFLNASGFGEMQSMRRLSMILLFILMGSATLNRSVVFRPIAACAMVPVLVVTFWTVGALAVQDAIHFSYRKMPFEANFGNTVDAGTHYVPILVFVTWLALTAKQRLIACAWGACALMLVVLIYLTWSRTAWLSGTISVALLLMFLASRKIRKIALLSFAAVTLLIAIYGRQVILLETVGRGLSQRDDIWTNILERMSGHWIFGHGAGANLGIFVLSPEISVAHAHNLYLELLFQYGVCGVFLMVLASLACLLKLFRLRRNPLAVLWLALLVGGMLAMGFAMSNFIGTPNRIWIFYWLPLAGALAIPAQFPVQSVHDRD
ncbi:MAG: O-antigen ligase family protein [Zoogloeaceae bacterium]|jgi:O-antigen ligase|nr:O-antigen ligase family protein [Zoogloeaceae bacterium]